MRRVDALLAAGVVVCVALAAWSALSPPPARHHPPPRHAVKAAADPGCRAHWCVGQTTATGWPAAWRNVPASTTSVTASPACPIEGTCWTAAVDNTTGSPVDVHEYAALWVPPAPCLPAAQRLLLIRDAATRMYDASEDLEAAADYYWRVGAFPPARADGDHFREMGRRTLAAARAELAAARLLADCR